jgi:hypothetical protein
MAGVGSACADEHEIESACGLSRSSRTLLEKLAQGSLGSVSNPASPAGLLVVVEEDLRTTLPRFDEEVCLEFEFTFDFRY